MQTSIVTFCKIHSIRSDSKLGLIATMLTSFCAEKIEFINGMYDVERSGDADSISIRGSGTGVCASVAGVVATEGLRIRLISVVTVMLQK